MDEAVHELGAAALLSISTGMVLIADALQHALKEPSSPLSLVYGSFACAVVHLP